MDSKFNNLYNKIITEQKESYLLNEGWFGFGKKKESANVKSSYCKKLWNDKNYDELVKQIREYKKDKQFNKDPDAVFYYGVLLLKDLIEENRLLLVPKCLLLESKAVQTDQKELDVVHFDIDKKHLRKIMRKAKFGNKDALYDLAVFYYVGIPDLLPQNMQKAIKCFKKAADKGCAEAQYNLGVMYERGYDRKDKEHENEFENYIQKDEDLAFKYYTKALQNGYEDAREPYEYLLNKKKLENNSKVKTIDYVDYTTNISKLKKGMQCIKVAANAGCEEAKKYMNDHFQQLKEILDYFIDTDKIYNQNLNKSKETPEIELDFKQA